MYHINEISNRDVSLLHYYRILRQPSDFLSAIYRDSVPDICTIQNGEATDIMTDDGQPVYSYLLEIEPQGQKIPYIEFLTDNESDRKKLEDLLYLDNMTLYSTSSAFSEPVNLQIYWVESLSDIVAAVSSYRDAIAALNIDKLKELYEERKKKPTTQVSISGRNQNLVQSSDIGMQDSGYMITSALDSQLLVNPSQELLTLLPSRLRHNIDILVTDGQSRYLSDFSGYSINIQGNCDWVVRDVSSGINFISGSGSVYLRNCSLVHFRNTLNTSTSVDEYRCNYLQAHRSLVIRNQGSISDVVLLGGSTLIDIPAPMSTVSSVSKIEQVSLVGYGCTLYSWSSTVPVDTANIQGTVWWLEPSSRQTALYIAGRRIDEAGGEHDSELHPSQVIEYDVDNIHIGLGGD